jgi:tetratricopeptide (TPR) repeat protein
MRLIAYFFPAVLLLSLAGCVTTGDSASQATPSQSGEAPTQVALFQPEPGLTAKQRLRKSIALLEVGQAGQAKAELQAYLTEQPRSKLASNLLQQIDADPLAELGKKHFIYKMEPGDSLSTVARQYLGDPMKFHLLARYNDLDNPSKIKAGQTIKVPGDKPAEPVREAGKPVPSDESAQPAAEETRTEPEVAATTEGAADGQAESGQDETEDAGEQTQTATRTEGDEAPAAQEEQATAEETEVERIQAVILKAEESAGAGDYQGAARHYEGGLVQFPDDVLIRQLAAANYLTFADQLSEKGRKEEAGTALQRAAELDPKSAEIKDRLAALARGEKADKIYLQGTEYLVADRPIDAFEAFTEALKLAPDHSAAGEERAKLVPVVTEQYHREAMTFFSRQDLDAALGIWDEKVLAIDPDYQPALLYRAQAIDLKQRLTDIPAEQPDRQ